ncbi:DUF6115 domain-containing protein [Desulforegula conservatrix]|uniref:DUF6115 domain-containing protein n=1 Tax=Desulforegula conservatrix TaxID=153026 RepID=UPI00040F6A3F|nr:hypothetical protein [Desulforegula conservatrix]
MDQFPIEYWIYFQLGIDICLILLILFFLRNLKKTLINQESDQPEKIQEPSLRSEIFPQIDTSSLDVLKALMESAKDSSEEFDRLIQEKKMLIAMLDEKLELKKREFIRIIKKGDAVTEELKRYILDAEDINSEKVTLKYDPAKKGRLQNNPPPTPDPEEMVEHEEVKPDQTEAIMELSSRGLENSAIAARLSIPIGEVELILGLNKIIKAEQRK